MIERLRRFAVPAFVVLLALAAVGTSAQTPCGPAQLQPLKQPDILTPDPKTHLLSTKFVVQMKDNPCVPVFDNASNTWKMQPMKLRTYGYPDPNKPGNPLKFATPGPTFSVRRATPPMPGDALSILLVNQLPVLPCNADPCDSACSSSNPQCCPAPGQPCPSTCANGCPQETFPACFHGDNNTNLHFHGTHVSPQAPQDYVLLDLAPEGSTPCPGAHAHTRGLSATGSYQYAINPFPANQAEGTHWYHPHKHGAVALQLLNGMGGALLIHGPFDDWLNGFYKNTLDEKLLVVQQLDDELNFFEKDPNYATPSPLINGQANPVVTMRPGEIQRWRLVNETMQASAQLTIGFETTSGPVLKQIAQDGVQFAPENYGSQPMISQGVQNLILSPGNRVDLLVQAPMTPGLHLLTYDVIGQLDPALKARLDVQRQGLLQSLKAPQGGKNQLLQGALKGLSAALSTAAAAATKPPLLTVNVVGTAKPMNFPTQADWPKMPPFLQDIQAGEIQNDRTILFSMTGVQGKQQNAFFINNKQFDPTCVDETMTLGKAEQWTVQNSSRPKHPFHIHTNPFQIIAQNGQSLPQPWIWWDTFPLPSVATTATDVNAGPIWNNDDAKVKCPKVCTNANATWNGQWKTTVPAQQSVCGCLTWGSIVTRSRFLDYTGEYVIHCHFLGHEDRGMMIGVQTTCSGTPNPLWGTTVSSGGADNCGMTLPASPMCK